MVASKPSYKVYDYAMSIHAGICMNGDGIELVAIKYGDKEVWRGEQADATTLPINLPDLFGGPKKEGGVKGLAWWLPGDADQVLPDSLAAKLGLTGATCPAYRGLASVWFTGTRNIAEVLLAPVISFLGGDPGNNIGGFYWGSNNPYLRKLAFRMRRPSVGLDPDLALIRIPDDSNGNAQYGSNGAHIIYECLTNREWGMGENPALIDKASFDAAAQTLFDEQFALNIVWTRQSEIGKFVGDVLSHVQGALYVDPRTGKHTLKLLRADYEVDTLPTINPGNAKLSSFKRKVWGEIANEMVVTYTDAETGKDATVTAQDLAGIAAEGGVVSSSQNYYAAAYQALAITLANRDLAMSVNPIATCDAEVTRAFWSENSGDVVKLNWPEKNIDQIVFRVSQVTRGANTVKLSLYEDIFGLDHANYLTPANSEWQNPSTAPQPVTYYQLGTAPAFLTYKALGIDSDELTYPEVLAFVNAGADSDDDVNFDLVTYLDDINGTRSQGLLATEPFRGTWVLLDGLPAEVQSTLPTLSGLRGVQPVVGDLILIGMGNDETTEIATVQSVGSSGFVLNRGMLDTVPKDWANGTRVFCLPVAKPIIDQTVRAISEDVSYWMQTRTTAGLLALDDAPLLNVNMSARPYLPNRPANVKVNGVAFGAVDASGATNVSVTWNNRNRLAEAEQALKWTDGNLAGETGQTTKIVVTTPGGSVVKTYAGLTGTSYTFPKTDLGANADVVVSVYAQRDAYQSLQGYALPVSLS